MSEKSTAGVRQSNVKLRDSILSQKTNDGQRKMNLEKVLAKAASLKKNRNSDEKIVLPEASLLKIKVDELLSLKVILENKVQQLEMGKNHKDKEEATNNERRGELEQLR